MEDYLKRDKNILANNIKRIRKKLKMNQEEFGKLFYPPAAKGIVSRWEQGKSIPNDQRLNKISQLSNVSKEKLIYGTIEEASKSLVGFAINNVFDEYPKKEDHSKEGYKFLDEAGAVNSIFYGLDFRFYNSKTGDNEKLKFDYYTSETIRRAKIFGVRSKDRLKIMDIIFKIAEEGANNQTKDDKGLVNVTLNGLYRVDNEIFNLIYVKKDDQYIRIAKDVSPKLEKEIRNDLDKIMTKLENLQEKMDH